MTDILSLSKIMLREGCFPIAEEELVEFLELGEEVTLKAKAHLFSEESVDQSIYVSASGVFKLVRFDGSKEKVMGFGGPGTMMLSPISHTLRLRPYYSLQAINDATFIRVSKEDFYERLDQSHAFSKWVLGVALMQFAALEMRDKNFSSPDIVSCYKQLVDSKLKLGHDRMDHNRNNLLNEISSKDLASYMGITQCYLSGIRKKAFESDHAR